jgi:ABC-type multidrug transport system fused ATPase/permease subunit
MALVCGGCRCFLATRFLATLFLKKPQRPTYTQKKQTPSKKPVLDDVSLTLRRGTVTALVGRSGAGKSTVASLLSRFYDPQRGGIYLGGAPAASFSRGEWARAVAMVSQEPVLFQGLLFSFVFCSARGFL